MLSCPKCENSFENTNKKYIKKYCSRKCANSKVWSDEDKLKKSLSSKNSEKALKAQLASRKRLDRKCAMCETIFSICPSNIRKTCSKTCNSKLRSLVQIGKSSGGYREGSGRAKTGWYQGIYCGSTYELVWVIYRLDNNLSVTRFQGYLTDGDLVYYPDFILDNHIIEIKGYYTDTVDKKTELAKEKGYTIDVLYKEDLKDCFDWVSTHYVYKNLQELYDDYKPKYSYTCSYCNIDFFRDKKVKTLKTYCSRLCSGYSLKIK